MLKPEEKYMKWCWDHNIKIYPTPITPCGTKNKIVVEYPRKTVIGDEVYEKKPRTVNVQQKTANGYVACKQTIPALYDKILELYKTIYFKHNPET